MSQGDDKWVNLLDVELEESLASDKRPGDLTRIEAKKQELHEIQDLEKRLSESFENLKAARTNPTVKRQLRLNVRRLEIMAIMVDNIRQQIRSLEEIDEVRDRRSKHPDWEERIGVSERNIAHLQQEILSARALFKNPIVASADCPPSPVLAVKSGINFDLDNLSAVASKLSLNVNDDAATQGAAGGPLDGPSVQPSEDAGLGAASSGSGSGWDGNAVAVDIPGPGDASVFGRFLTAPLPKHSRMTCDVVRHKGRFGLNTFELFDHASGAKLLTASKKAALGKQFKITQYAGGGSADKGLPIAEFSAGMGHHEHKLVLTTTHREAAVVYYKVDHSNIERTEYGVTLTVVLPGVDLDDAVLDEVTRDIYRQYEDRQFDNIVVLNNKRAVWVPSLNAHILTYASKRITGAGISSVKNFLLASRLNINHVLIEFGKIGEDKFELSFQYPLSPVAAFATCLVMFH